MSTAHFGRAVPVGLRRFPILLGRTLSGKKIEIPNSLEPVDAPFHVMTLNFKNKHQWNARTWTGLHSSLDILSTHAGDSSQPGMYHVWVFPTVYWLWSPLWKSKCKRWAVENNISLDSVAVVYGNRSEITDAIGVHNDGRQYAFLIRNSGKVLFATDGRYFSHKHDFHIHKAINAQVREKVPTKERNETEP